MGIDALLEDRALSRLRISISVDAATKIETFKKPHVSDSGSEEILRYYTERDAYLVTIYNWDRITDQETVLRMTVVPMLQDRFKLDPKIPVMFQFFDTLGRRMRHKPTPGPHVMVQGS